MSNLYDGKAALALAAKKLKLRWNEAQQDWNDSVSRRFERDHLAPLEPQINTVIQAIDRLADILQRAELDCRPQTDSIA